MNIVKSSYKLSDTILNIAQASNLFDFTRNEIKVFERIYGIKNLPIDCNITVDELLISALDNCLDHMSRKWMNIKFIIHAHTGNHISPFGKSIVRLLQQNFDIHSAISFGMNLYKCGSVFSAIQLSEHLSSYLREDDYILILIGDVSFTKILKYIPGTTITTDGASVIMLAKMKSINQIISIKINTFGEYAKGIWDNSEVRHQFEMNYTHYLSSTILQAIYKANISLSDVKIILPHNVNLLSWQLICNDLDISIDKIFLDNISVTAHCFGADPFINLETALKQHKINPGDYYVMATVGLGATFAAMVIQH